MEVNFEKTSHVLICIIGAPERQERKGGKDQDI